jgi:Family of unknown function (DUF6440)
VLGVMSCVLVGASIFALSRPLDATDNHVTGDRSGLFIMVDHGTGCQYLRSGSITPRLDAQGKPICGVKQ